MILRKIYYSFSPVVRRIIRRFVYFPIDIIECLIGKRDKMTPPRGRIFIGSGDFKSQGERITDQLVRYGGLKPDYKVLDIGCGIGRIAGPLTKYLSADGVYDGFDVVKAGISWCQKNISSLYPNFHFTHIDLKNDLYNLKTARKAKDFVFPYPNEFFDFVFLISVFTHMLPEDVDGYLKQIHRVLKNGGTCFSTFFILNKNILSRMDASAGIKFKYNMGNYMLHHKKVKEANVAYDEHFLEKELIETCGFSILQRYPGYWPDGINQDSLDFQDILIFKKV